MMAGDGNYRRDGRVLARRRRGGALGRRRGGGIRDGELVFLRGWAGFVVPHLCRAAFPVAVLLAIGLFGIGVGAAGGGILVLRRPEKSPVSARFGMVVAGPPPAKLEGQSLHWHGWFLLFAWLDLDFDNQLVA